jgi:hypothetical protein
MRSVFGIRRNPCGQKAFRVEYKLFFQKNIRGALAQLARAPALQAGGPGFESLTLHHEGL